VVLVVSVVSVTALVDVMIYQLLHMYRQFFCSQFVCCFFGNDKSDAHFVCEMAFKCNFMYFMGENSQY